MRKFRPVPSSCVALGFIVVLSAAGCKKVPEPSAQPLAEDAGSPTTEPHARILGPADDSRITGLAEFNFELDFAGQPLEVYFGAEEEIAGSGPLRFVTPVLSLDTTAYSNGPHTFVLQLRGADGQVWQDTLEVQIENPKARFLGYETNDWQYASGAEVEIIAEFSQSGLSVSADFSALDPALAADSIVVTDVGAGQYRVTAQLGTKLAPDGTYEVVLLAQDPAGGGSVTTRVPITLRNQPSLPFRVRGAQFVDEVAPAPTTNGQRPPLKAVTIHGPLLSGSSTTLSVELDPEDTTTDRLLVSVAGYRGYFVVPVAPGESKLELTLANLRPQVEGLLDVVVTGMAPDGDSAGATTTSISVRDVALGGLQISLTWDAPVDLDLSVIDPAGKLIDFENPKSNGGGLNLDANSLCELSSSNAENIAWPPGKGLSGEYQVRVNLFDACGHAGPVHWSVVVSPGTGTVLESAARPGAPAGASSVDYSGDLNSSSVDQSGAGQSAGPPVTVGSAQTIAGKVKFQTALRGKKSFLPVRSAPIQALSMETPPQPLGDGVTDDQGAYSINMTNPDLKPFFLQLDAAWLDSRSNTVLAQVQSAAGTLRSYTTPVITPMPGTTSVQNISLKIADGSGPFNIVNAMRKGYEWVARHAPAVNVPPVSAKWDAGAANGGSAYIPNSHQFTIQGDAANPDEFDDWIILHEFNHYLQEVLGTPAVGGPHSTAMNPDIAYSEGMASAMAMNILGISDFVENTDSNTKYTVMNLETTSGNKGGATITSPVSEWLITMIALDLYDPKNEPHDKIAEPDATLRTYFFDLAKRPAPNARGVAGLDLVDLLDGFRCETGAKMVSGGSPRDADLDKLLKERAFKYDMAVPACPP